ncbi:MAG: hypothetical protein JNK88_00570, partial [Mangrovicoccus sp.]|nr:hypothetical protein [Mangrovicoccus sp.]
GFVLAVHAVMAGLGWFVMASSLQDAALNISVQGLGIVLGWWIGMWVSSSSSRQRADMTSFGKAVTAFGTGYVLSKIDPVITHSLSTNEVDPMTLFRALAFLSSCSAQALLVALMTWYDVRPMPERLVDPPLADATGNAQIDPVPPIT